MHAECPSVCIFLTWETESGMEAQKNRPRYSQDGAAKSRKSLYQEAGDVLLQQLQLPIIAIHHGVKGAGEMQAEHFHEAFAIDLHVVIPDINGIRLGGGNGNEFLNILDAGEPYFKFLHKNSTPGNYTKLILLCIMGGQYDSTPMTNIIAFFCENAIVGLDD